MIIEQTKQHHDEGSKPIVVVAQCLKITEKVAFHIASQASGQKLIKIAKNCQFWRVFQNLKVAVKKCYQICHFYWTKIDGKCQNSNATFWVIFQHCEIFIWAFSMNFCPFNIDLSGNPV